MYNTNRPAYFYIPNDRTEQVYLNADMFQMPAATRHNQFPMPQQQALYMPSYVMPQQQPPQAQQHQQQQQQPPKQMKPAPPPTQPHKANKAIPIVNPQTMKPIDLSSIRSDISEKNYSPPLSRESSARNTPAPEPILQTRATEIGAEFATKVVQARDETRFDCPPKKELEESNIEPVAVNVPSNLISTSDNLSNSAENETDLITKSADEVDPITVKVPIVENICDTQESFPSQEDIEQVVDKIPEPSKKEPVEEIPAPIAVVAVPEVVENNEPIPQEKIKSNGIKSKKNNGKGRKSPESTEIVHKEVKKVSEPVCPQIEKFTNINVEEAAPGITFGDLSDIDVASEQHQPVVTPVQSAKPSKADKNRNKKSSSPVIEKVEKVEVVSTDLPMEIKTEVTNSEVNKGTEKSRKKNKKKNVKAGKNKNSSQGADKPVETEKDQSPSPPPPSSLEKKPDPVVPTGSEQRQQPQSQTVSFHNAQQSVDAMLPSYHNRNHSAMIAMMPPFAQAQVDAAMLKHKNNIVKKPLNTECDTPEAVPQKEESQENVSETKSETNDESEKEHLNKSEGIVEKTEDSVNVATNEVPAEDNCDQLENVESGPQTELSLTVSDEDENGSKRISYGREFILEKQRTEQSLCRPKLLPTLEVILTSPHSQPYSQGFQEIRMPMDVHHGRQMFNNRGIIARSSRTFPPKKISLNLSNEGLRNKSENPYNVKKSKASVLELNETDAREETVRKLCRSCLNKLTPENFTTLCSKHFSNSTMIETVQDLLVVISEIYEKALVEICYAELYAKLCMYIHNNNQVNNKADMAKQFRTLIISKCQSEFETDRNEANKHVEWQEKIKKAEEENNVGEIKELKLRYEMHVTKVRKRSVANINFVGQLYNAKLLSSKPMYTIIDTLLKTHAEEQLECLCQLLQTIGKEYEKESRTSFTQIFGELNTIVASRHTSSRIRFLLMDIIDLRLNHWVPRRVKEKPLTKEEVKNKAAQEALSIEINNFDNKPSRDYRRRDIVDNHHQQMRSNNHWQTAGGNSHRKVDFPQITKTMKADASDVNLRPPPSYWGCGSNVSGAKQSQGSVADTSAHGNRYAPLNSVTEKQKQNIPPRMANNPSQRQGTTYGSKSMPPPNNNQLQFPKKQNTIDRSKSSSRSNSRDGKNDARIPKQKVLTDKEQEQLEIYMKSISTYEDAKDESIQLLKKYFFNISEGPASEKQAIINFIALLKENNFWFVKSSMEWIVDQKEEKIHYYKDLLAGLAEEKVVSIEIIIQEISCMLDVVEDLSIDVPMVPKHMGSILGALVGSEIVPFTLLPSLLEKAGGLKADVFCYTVKEALIKLDWVGIMKQIAPPFTLSTIFQEPRDYNLLEQLSLEKLKDFIGPDAKNYADHLLTPLTKLFESEKNNDKIFNLIDEKYKGDTKSKKFVRVLVTALIESLLVRSNDGEPVTLPENLKDISRRKVDAIQKYVDNSSILELQCLYALQALSFKYQHPKRFLENCFDLLYSFDIVTEDTYILWAKSDDQEEQGGRGVCLRSVGNWLKWLETTEPDVP